MIQIPPNTPDPRYFIRNEVAQGARNNQNLAFTTAQKFAAGTLVVYIDGIKKLSGGDFQESVNLDGFTFIINPSDPNRLNKPPLQSEEVTVSYIAGHNEDCMINI